VAVGKFEVAGSPRSIDCKGLIVAPGFIDLHSHSDSGIVQPKTRQNANFSCRAARRLSRATAARGPSMSPRITKRSTPTALAPTFCISCRTAASAIR